MPDAGTPNFSAWRRAASGRRSATIRTSRSGNARMFARYCSLIVPGADHADPDRARSRSSVADVNERDRRGGNAAVS